MRPSLREVSANSPSQRAAYRPFPSPRGRYYLPSTEVSDPLREVVRGQPSRHYFEVVFSQLLREDICQGYHQKQGFLMAWQYVSRKGGGKGRNGGVQDQLLQSMTAMQNSISQLAQSICTKPPPGSKGQGKGKPPKGQGKGVKSSPGERKSPNLEPEEERAEPTTEEVKCPKCPNTYNWTTRVVCRSCRCKLPQGNVHKAPSPPKSVGPANVKTGGGGSSSGASSGTSYASVVKGETVDI